MLALVERIHACQASLVLGYLSVCEMSQCQTKSTECASLVDYGLQGRVPAWFATEDG